MYKSWKVRRIRFRIEIFRGLFSCAWNFTASASGGKKGHHAYYTYNNIAIFVKKNDNKNNIILRPGLFPDHSVANIKY